MYKVFHWSLMGAGLGLLVTILSVYCGWFLFPSIIHKKVEESVIISDGSEQYKRFVQLPQPLNFKVYIFNVTNPYRVQQGGIPIVEEIGPYIYKQYRTKKVKQFSHDGSKITFVQDQLYIFDKEASAPLQESDHIVALNMHMNAFLQVFEREITDILQGFANRINSRLNRTPGVRVLKRLMDRIRGKRKSVLQIGENDPSLALLLVHLNANLKAIFNDPKTMFVRTTVREYLFDGVRFCINPQGLAKAICNQIKEGASKTIRELKDGSLAFSFFNHKNGSGNEVYEVHTGKGDPMRVLEIQKLDDNHNLQVWLNSSDNNGTSKCNQINGTDASSYPPFRQKGDSMYIFSADICRSVQLFYQKEIMYKGIPGYRYSIGENFVNDIGPEHDNECYCVDKLTNVIKRKNGCLYAGALDLTTCLAIMTYSNHILQEERIAVFLTRDISTWVCIAEHESQFNTAAIRRLSTDGSADHGLFQISDRYWCDHGSLGGKACNLPCDNLLDEDLSDDVACIKIIHNEHTRLSGDGFNAWTVYRTHCQNQNTEHIRKCFDDKTLSSVEQIVPAPNSNVATTQGNGKIYTKCELAEELFHKHHMPIDQIPKWVCIAQHESLFNTAAVGRLNTDGSADYGLFQISDLYWCSHDQYGGKACNIPCHKLLDSDITDDIRCIKVIHEEHTRISGDGFNAWTVYQPHCHNTGMEHIKQCFTEQELSSKIPNLNSNSLIPQNSFGSKAVGKGKIYKKCELAQELYHKHHMPMEQIPKWVCIAQHESSFNTAAVGRLNSDGSADHGLFQVSDLYWCTHDKYGGKACNIPCDKLLDSDITDDVKCIRIIHEEHTRISGDGFNAWTVYKPNCRNTGIAHIQDCFTEKELKEVQTSFISNSLVPQISFSSKPASKGKIYKKCELAQELFQKHHMPMEQIPKWVCIAQHESSYNTAAVGRLNTDGSADHGLFQISDLYWCTHDQYGGKACNIPCHKLLDSDITDDVECIKIIHEEHTGISGDGFNAWTVYKPHCRNKGMTHIKECFTEQELKKAGVLSTSRTSHSMKSFVPKGKVYSKCELAQELLTKHGMLMEQIPTWVCIAQHESSFNTAAVGNLNTDKSLDLGLFQINDRYWCSHDQFGGKGCNIPCDSLLDSDITDDVKCVKMVHEEHAKIAGDGFNAWTVYKLHCLNRNMEEIRSCFSTNQFNGLQTNQQTSNIVSKIQQVPSNSSYSHNPFLNRIKPQTSQIVYNTSTYTNVQNEQSNYAKNPFLQNTKNTGNSEIKRTVVQVPTIWSKNERQNYKKNPFLDRALKPSPSNQNYKQSVITTKATTKNDGVFTNQNKFSTTLKPTKPSASLNDPFFQHTLAYKTDNNKNYLNSNDFRTTTTPKPRITAAKSPTKAWTTTTKRPTSTTARPTTTIKPIKKETDTTKKLATITTTIKSSTTTIKSSPTTTIKPSTKETTTPKIHTTTATTTTTKKSPTTTWTTKPPKTTTTWSWQYQKSTTKQPKTTTTTNWQNQKYQSSTTTKPQKTNTTTKHPKTITSWSWKTQNYSSSTTPKSAKITTSWKSHNQKYSNNTTLAQTATHWNKPKDQTTKSLANTTAKPERTTWNWRNEQKSSTTKPFTTTDNWRKWDKTTSKKAMTSAITTTRTTTQKPTRSWLSTTTKLTTARTTKAPQATSTLKPKTKRPYYNDNLKTTTLRPSTTTTIKSESKKTTLTTTTLTPSTTNSFASSEYNKYKNDPFSHPFFTKFNEEFKQFRSNITTTKLPRFSAAKPSHS